MKKIKYIILITIFLLFWYSINILNKKIDNIIHLSIRNEIRIDNIENNILCYWNKPWMLACWDILENLKKRNLEINK